MDLSLIASAVGGSVRHILLVDTVLCNMIEYKAKSDTVT